MKKILEFALPLGAQAFTHALQVKFVEEQVSSELLKFDDKVQENPNLNWGITNFDHIGNSMFLVHQVSTTDSWTVNMYNLMDSTSPAVGSLFFVSIAVIGNFFLLNLILAVILDSFIQIQQLDMLEQLGEGEDVDDKDEIKQMIRI